MTFFWIITQKGIQETAVRRRFTREKSIKHLSSLVLASFSRRALTSQSTWRE